MWNGFFNPVHEIIPPQNGKGGLYLGNIESARSSQIQIERGITAVLTVANIAHAEKMIPPNIKFHQVISIDDAPFEDIKQYFPQTNDFIRQHLEQTNVLVHCMAGVSRSASVVIAYMMQTNKWTLEKSYKYVRDIRNIVGPNDGFLKQLKAYEAEIFENS